MSYLDYLASGLCPLSLIQSVIENSFFSWSDLSMYLPHFDVMMGMFQLLKYFVCLNIDDGQSPEA
jgi:hypothetical protein